MCRACLSVVRDSNIVTCRPSRPATRLPSLRHRASLRDGRWRDPTQRDNMGSVGSSSPPASPAPRCPWAWTQPHHSTNLVGTTQCAITNQQYDQFIYIGKSKWLPRLGRPLQRWPRTTRHLRRWVLRPPRRSRSSPAGISQACRPWTMQLRTQYSPPTRLASPAPALLQV